jgi:CheY-like chemotaxis protein
MAQIGLLEDNARVAKLCATMLHYAGHQVTIYEHPRECLHALLPPRSKNDAQLSSSVMSPGALPIDVLILDLNLPDMGGLEVLSQLHACPHTRFIPLVFCTAASRKELIRAIALAPYASVVEKPFKLDALAEAITKALNTRV